VVINGSKGSFAIAFGGHAAPGAERTALSKIQKKQRQRLVRRVAGWLVTLRCVRAGNQAHCCSWKNGS
jgi:hypothetical protein